MNDIATAIAKIAQATGERTAAEDVYGPGLCGSPIIEMRVEGDRVTFIFDFLLLFSAQSGSDWHEHHVFRGNAKIDGAELRDVSLVEVLGRNLTEHDVERADPPYDRRAVVNELWKT